MDVKWCVIDDAVLLGVWAKVLLFGVMDFELQPTNNNCQTSSLASHHVLIDPSLLGCAITARVIHWSRFAFCLFLCLTTVTLHSVVESVDGTSLMIDHDEHAHEGLGGVGLKCWVESVCCAVMILLIMV